MTNSNPIVHAYSLIGRNVLFGSTKDVWYPIENRKTVLGIFGKVTSMTKHKDTEEIALKVTVFCLDFNRGIRSAGQISRNEVYIVGEQIQRLIVADDEVIIKIDEIVRLVNSSAELAREDASDRTKQPVIAEMLISSAFLTAGALEHKGLYWAARVIRANLFVHYGHLKIHHFDCEKEDPISDAIEKEDF